MEKFIVCMYISGFLIQDENLTECTAKEKEENKAHTKTAPEFAVKNILGFGFTNLIFQNSNSPFHDFRFQRKSPSKRLRF